MLQSAGVFRAIDRWFGPMRMTHSPGILDPLEKITLEHIETPTSHHPAPMPH
jgi:hypothetical protein